jgi:hypothetical protein
MHEAKRLSILQGNIHRRLDSVMAALLRLGGEGV